MLEQFIIDFEKLTKFPLNQYLTDCNDFFKFGYNNIAQFYNGSIPRANPKYIKQHIELLKQSERLNDQFKNHSSRFSSVGYWELIDYVDDIRTKLQTISKLSKYLRSSRTDFNFSQGYAHPYVIGAEQTLEQISSNILEDNDANNDWVDIAIKNDLRETEYDIDGGDGIILYKEFFNQNFVTSVIDNMIGEKIYGLDIQKRFEFVDDDLKVLSYKETAYQTVLILSRLNKGDIPEFVDLGIDRALYIGSNLGTLAFSSIIREMTKVFNSDDLFINFEVLSIKIEQDNFNLSFRVGTKYELLIEETTLI